MAGYLRIVLEKRAGFEVVHTADPQEALTLIRGGGFDVLLTDIELPGLTGLQIAASVRDSHPHLPIMVMTAHASVDYAITALRSQVDEFVLKPVDSADLIAKVNALVTLGRSRESARTAQVVLVVGAHPDDAEIGVGGLMAAHRAAGDQVVILTLSRGARGGAADDRQHESLAAAELIGARLFMEDLEDTKISSGDPTVGMIERVIAEVSPTIMYTHSIHDRHQDHRAVHQAAAVAARKVPTFACFQSPSATVDFRPNRFAPIDTFESTKLALLAAFSSQASVRDYLEPDFVLATARYWSRFGGGRSAEPLEVIRDVAGVSGPAAAARSDPDTDGSTVFGNADWGVTQ
ncbi:N-acetylglucosaminyl deacetylase, LmbE family [Nakamurella panacisegetis]|uniref:N-acetylglucosaminyl deacetylase, LmbE family n=1 Tax=Nakamurella panacisegetis TaxID=1090615 RepID=A0A1H0S5T0_9ACTN|nr:N-acetylglucosaminyl deacetylase, LmbE family [Nakamurella panacisegetis]